MLGDVDVKQFKANSSVSDLNAWLHFSVKATKGTLCFTVSCITAIAANIQP